MNLVGRRSNQRLKVPLGTALTTAALLSMSACLGPRPEAPSASAIAAPRAWRSPIGPAAPIEADWWRAFHDPVLTALVERALASNADIGVAVGRVEEARALTRLASAQQAPLATVGSTGGDGRTVILGQGVDAFVAQPQVSISYDLDIFGRLREASAAARATLLATEATRDSVLLGVASSTAAGYISLLGFDARLATARATLLSRSDALRYARRRAAAGYTSQLELHQAEAEYQATAQLVPPAELAVTRQEDALSILVGDPPEAIRRGVALEALTTPAVPDGLPSDLLRRRPDIYSAEETLVASDRTLDSSRAAILPNLSLTGSAGLALSTALANPITLFSVGASVLAPLFDGGRLHAQADASAARRDQAAYAYRRTVLNAFREVEDGFAAAHRLDEQQASLRLQVTALQETLRISTNRYREGYSPYLDQLDAERGLLTAQLSLIQAENDRLVAFVTLYQAMGGGWMQPPKPA